jgi:hypothetical protein
MHSFVSINKLCDVEVKNEADLAHTKKRTAHSRPVRVIVDQIGPSQNLNFKAN